MFKEVNETEIEQRTPQDPEEVSFAVLDLKHCLQMFVIELLNSASLTLVAIKAATVTRVSGAIEMSSCLDFLLRIMSSS